MKTHPRIITLFLLAALLPLLSGCAGKEIRVALQTYTLTMKEIVAARDAGKISDKTQAQVVAPAREAAKSILDEMVDGYVKGTGFDWRLALRRFYDAMAPLLRQQELLKGDANASPH